jgi:hypothetical protein
LDAANRFERFLAPTHQPWPTPSKLAHYPPQPPTGGIGHWNAEMHCEQLVCRHPLLPAHQLPANAGQDLVPVTRVAGHGSASIASAPEPMESYHTVYKFGVGPRNEARVPKFLPRSVRPGFLPSLGWQHPSEGAAHLCPSRKRPTSVAVFRRLNVAGSRKDQGRQAAYSR